MDSKSFSVSVQMFGFVFLVLSSHNVNGDVSYSFPEEMKRGYVIGNIAKDLGLDVNRLSSRKARIDTEGNRKRFCEINFNTGELTVAERIDRESLCGKKASCVIKQELVLENPLELHRFILNIQDINDNLPQFKETILYPSPDGNSFMTEMVPKAAQAGSLVSKVIAVDADSGQNAWLTYHIIKASDPGLFTIGVHSGEIRTQRDLSESDSMKQNLIVLVKDNGQPSLSATCALYLLISDNLAEVPELKDMSHDESSSKLTFYLIIALVSVSTFFLTFIIIILAVRFCRRRKPRLLFDGAVAIPSAYLPPNYAEVEGAGTLRSTYNYDAYLTTGSRTSDFKFVRSYNEDTLTGGMTLKKTPSAVDDLEGLDAENVDSFQISLSLSVVILWYLNGIFCVSAQKFGFVFFVLLSHTVNGDVSYSFLEEMKHVSVIENMPKDLGLDVNRLSSRKARIDTEASSFTHLADAFIQSDLHCIILYICLGVCAFPWDRTHHLGIDINDNSPQFKESVIKLKIRESAFQGSRYLLDEANNADIVVNSVQTYTLQNNEHFMLNVLTRTNGRKYGELVLNKELDREQQKEVTLILTAVDGGTPPRSGTVVIHVTVLDANDNAPVFSQAVYKVSLPENSPVDTVVVTVSATDADEGQNGEVTYAFGHLPENFLQLFYLDPASFEIKLKEFIDYEEESVIELQIQAKDSQGLASHSAVLIEIVDVNDNAAIIIIKSLNSPVPDNASPGTEVGIINVQDRDSENNGQVRSIQQNVPFKLVPSIKNYYSLVTTGELDRELVSDYNITITATDEGSPDPGLFTIGVPSGEIRTQRDLSESDSMKRTIIASVRYRTALPVCHAHQMYLYQIILLNSSKLTFYLIIALVSVSTFFLTFIIIILAVRFCRRRKPRLLFDGVVAIPSAYLPPNYAEVEGAGTLRSTYYYDAYLTTGSRTSDFKFVRSYNEDTLTADMTLKKTHSAVDDLEGLYGKINSSFEVRFFLKINFVRFYFVFVIFYLLSFTYVFSPLADAFYN
ncbi:hypothetical protein IRJ41_017423 [Triplophysa rosa]|uniref:Cadherin domain-containing protein n=1 Tax=Triplophysa rosa TaxID=992332 RepID=A0A9W7TT80_TRIRA|nr:hypothetical protein IRJ41_017423 [Triplophysa rosa]